MNNLVDSHTHHFSDISHAHLPQPSARLKLRTGHSLSYEEYGNKDGFPLFYFHDSGSSRLECAFFHSSASRLNYRLISIDRPGIGCTDYYTLNNSTDFAKSVLELADLLAIQEFGLISLGAGGIHSMALAHLAPTRVKLQLSLAGVPGNVFNESPNSSYASNCLNELAPALVKFLFRLKYTIIQNDPEELIERLRDYLSYTDRKTLSDPQVLSTLALDQQEAMRSGHRGIAQDMAICYRKLDFSLETVKVPTLIWQGCADRLSQRSDCEYMAGRLPMASLHRVPNQGHFFFVHGMDDVFYRLRALQEHGMLKAA